jgi:hypothetical protein
MMPRVLNKNTTYWAIVVLCGLLFLPAQQVNAESTPRLIIKLSKYEGDPQSAFGQFYSILKNKLLNMSLELSEKDDPNGGYLAQLELDRTGVEAPLTNEAKLDYWEKTGALALLEGVIFSSGDGEIVIISTADLGGLGENLPKRTIDLELKVEPREFRSMRDAHSLATLYALAMDAARLKKPDRVRIAILSKAYAIAQDLGSHTSPDIEFVKKEIKQMLDTFTSSEGGGQ